MDIQIKTAAFGRGFGWLNDGLEIFTRNPLGWIAAVIVVFIIMAFVGIIPLGGLLVYLLYPVFVGGFMLGCKAQLDGEQFEFQHAFAGFQSRYLKPLVVFGVYYMIANIFIIVLVVIFMVMILGGMELLQQIQDMQPEELMALQKELLLVLLVASALYLPVVMAAWFAPALLVTTDIEPWQAMRLSFKACLYNIPAFTLYGIIVMVLGILAAIPLGLGYLILFPVLTGSVFSSYRDCFIVSGMTTLPEQQVET